MYILLRHEEKEIRKGLEAHGYPVHVLPDDVYIGSPVAVILVNPTLDGIKAEADAIGGCCICTRIIVITDSCHGYLIGKLFPEVFVIPDNAPSLFSSIEKAIIGNARAGENMPELTDSELALLHEIGYGLSNKELACRLDKSERTIRRIKESLFLKTGLVSSEQLLLYTLYRLNNRSSSHTLDKV